jgi:hypothetical protein
MADKTIHPELAAKLKLLTEKYHKVTAFAELLPMFNREIIESELTTEHFSKLAYRYGKLDLAWGANWYTNIPTNYPSETHKELGFVHVYINTYSLFGDACSDFASTELGLALPHISVHFYDALNSTFYFLPHEAQDGLDKLEDWYVSTKAKCDEYLKGKRKAALERELKELQGEQQ